MKDPRLQSAHGRAKEVTWGMKETPYERGEEQTLGRRELQIVFLASHGIRDKKIAQMLGIKPQTVYHFWRSAFLKTRTHNKTQLVAKCFRNGTIL